MASEKMDWVDWIAEYKAWRKIRDDFERILKLRTENFGRLKRLLNLYPGENDLDSVDHRLKMRIADEVLNGK